MQIKLFYYENSFIILTIRHNILYLVYVNVFDIRYSINNIDKQHWIGEKKSREQKLMGRPETWLLTFISKMVLDDDIPYNKK